MNRYMYPNFSKFILTVIFSRSAYHLNKILVNLVGKQMQDNFFRLNVKENLNSAQEAGEFPTVPWNN